MKGHIRERGKGNWYAVFRRKDPATGKERLIWQKLKAKGKREAQEECAGLISAMASGTYLEPGKMSLREFLERWLEHIKPNVSPRTYQRYEQLTLKNIAPLLGEARLTQLQPIQISTAYVKAVSAGRRDGRGGLSARTVHHMHRVLRAALAQAMKWNMLIKNPCDMLERKDRPRVERKPVAVMDIETTLKMLEAARGSRLFIPMLLGAMCGIRRGEICALRWRNVDFETGQLAVSHSVEQVGKVCREKETKGSKARTVAMSALLMDD